MCIITIMLKLISLKEISAARHCQAATLIGNTTEQIRRHNHYTTADPVLSTTKGGHHEER